MISCQSMFFNVRFLLFSFLVFGAALNQAKAHYCAPPFPCKKYWEAQAVFTGTVTKAFLNKTQQDQLHKVIVHVDEAFKGRFKAGEDVELVDNSEYRESEHFQKGEKYFIYAIGSYVEPGRYAGVRICYDASPCVGDQAGTLYAGLAICSATKPLAYAAADIEYARNVQAGQGGMIFGRVSANGGPAANTVNSLVRDESDSVVGRTVSVTSAEGRRYEAQTDNRGWFEIKRLPASTYALALDLPQGFHPLPGRSVKLEPNRCQVEYLSIFSEQFAQLSGKLLDAQNRPRAHDGVFLVPADKAAQVDGRDYQQYEYARVDENGGYRFNAVPPGRYALVANPEGAEESDPYVTEYFGGGTRPEQATILELGAGQRRDIGDFRLAAKAALAQAQGAVSWADGRPAAKTRVRLVRAGGKPWDVVAEVRADEAGKFSLPCFEGRQYTLYAQYYQSEQDYSKGLEQAFSCPAASLDLLLQKAVK